MRIGEISFCNHIGFNIKSDELKKRILDEIDMNFKKKIIQKHHDKFNESMVKTLNANPYMMTLRSNGNPYFLYLTRYNNVNQCIFIDKKIQQGYMYPRMVIVKFWFNDILFNNTLFDGEMVKETSGNNWLFLVHDIIGDCGSDMMSVNIVKRINRCYDIFDKLFVPDIQDICHFQVKRYFHYEDYNVMVNEFMPKLTYTCRGIYFNPLYLKFKNILYNFDDTLVKHVVKTKCKTYLVPDEMPEPTAEAVRDIPMQQPPPPPRQSEPEKTEMLLIQKTNQPDIYEVFTMGSKPLGHACVNNIKVSKLLREAFMHTTPVDKLKFRCSYNEKFMKWTPNGAWQGHYAAPYPHYAALTKLCIFYFLFFPRRVKYHR